MFTTVNEPSQLAKLLPSQLRTILNDLTKSKIHYYGISDSFVVAVPLGTTDHCEPVNGIHSALLASCWTQLLALDRKHAVRGGIDVGIGLEENGEIYGSALERAYTLESQIAARPRVVVGEELIHYLEYVRDQQPTTLRQEVAKLIATRCLTFIKPDIDGRLILDFLGESSRKALSTVVQPDMFKKAYDFVNDEFAKWSKAGDTKLASRYDELRSYFEAYKAQWGL